MDWATSRNRAYGNHHWIYVVFLDNLMQDIQTRAKRDERTLLALAKRKRDAEDLADYLIQQKVLPRRTFIQD
jgi:excinuclease UvrABC helicase subunit UvrB